ncbi:hypothetical protein GBA52_006739 [Prunus armeniaca]|nr:hypothetical protein GBA52_006739 [Prunus armeniaca]
MEVLSELNIGPSIQFITVFVVTLIAIFAGYYFKFKASFPVVVGKKLPPGSFGLPLIGESISFIRAQKEDKTGEWIQTRIRKYGPVFKTSLMGSKTVVLTGQAGDRLLFGLPEGQEKDALLEDFAIATKGLWAIPLNIPGTIFYKAMQARGRISKIFINLMQNRRVEEDKNNPQKNDIISVFFHLRDEAGEPLQVEEILDFN